MYQKKWSSALSTILHRCFSNFFRNPAKPIDFSQVFRVASEISLLCSLSCGTSGFYQCLKFRTFGRKPLSSCVLKKKLTVPPTSCNAHRLPIQSFRIILRYQSFACCQIYHILKWSEREANKTVWAFHLSPWSSLYVLLMDCALDYPEREVPSFGSRALFRPNEDRLRGRVTSQFRSLVRGRVWQGIDTFPDYSAADSLKFWQNAWFRCGQFTSLTWATSF